MNSLNDPIPTFPLFEQTDLNLLPPDPLKTAHSLDQDILGGAIVVIGLFVTFFGAKFHRQLIFFIGLIAGGFLAYTVIPEIASLIGTTIKENPLLISALVFGVLCGAFLVFVTKVVVFCVGAVCGGIVSQVLWLVLVTHLKTPLHDKIDEVEDHWMIIARIGITIIFVAIGVYLAFKFVEIVMKAGTAFIGGFLFASGVAYWIGRLDTSKERNVVDWVVFFAELLSLWTMSIPTLFQSTDLPNPNILETAHDLNQDILGGTMVVVGLFATFFGAKYFKQMIFFIGFIIGGFLAYFSTPVIYKFFGGTVEDDTLLYISLVFGAFCGILLVVVYKAAVFSVGAICGAIFSQILWIAIVPNINTPDEDYMVAIQIGVLIAFALVGGYLAFKFVKQVMKGVTAFLGAFLFSSGVAYFISRIDATDERNVIDWVVFFGAYQNYANLDEVCDVYCIVCVLLWLIMFAVGCFVQYKLFKKEEKDKDNEEYETDSDESDSESAHKSKKNKRRKSDSYDSYSESSRKSKKNRNQKQRHHSNYDGNDQYAGSSHYGGSIRQNQQVLGSYSNHGQPPQIAMSQYEGQQFYNGQNQQPRSAPGYAQSLQDV